MEGFLQASQQQQLSCGKSVNTKFRVMCGNFSMGSRVNDTSNNVVISFNTNKYSTYTSLMVFLEIIKEEHKQVIVMEMFPPYQEIL